MIALMALKSAVNLLSPGALSNITPLTCDFRQRFVYFIIRAVHSITLLLYKVDYRHASNFNGTKLSHIL